ncbi:hypothetical protein CSB37_02880 [bacterium DOLZORAL124_38_8]|nr:MAG: hypothetical protein CSB37_02880 [bacterium DOLZORAL124_38_8]
MNDTPKTSTENKTSFVQTLGNACTSLGRGVKMSVAGTMSWIRNFFFKVWSMLLLTALTFGLLFVLLAYAVSILDGTTSFKRLCGDQSIIACVTGIKDKTPVEKEAIIKTTNQESPTNRSKEVLEENQREIDETQQSNTQ